MDKSEKSKQRFWLPLLIWGAIIFMIGGIMIHWADNARTERELQLDEEHIPPR